MRQLPDGDWLLRVNGTEVQTITLEQKRSVLVLQAERDSFAKQIAALQEQVKVYGQLKQTSDRIEVKLTPENAQLDQMLTSCNALALDLKGLVDDYRRAARVGKVAKALNHPAWKIFAALIPLGAAALAR